MFFYYIKHTDFFTKRTIVSLLIKMKTFHIVLFFLLFSGMLSAQTSNQRIESEYKLAVPEGQEDALWEYLQNAFSTKALLEIDSHLYSNTSSEIFIDHYFDNAAQVLLENGAGARHRKRFLKDSLIKELVQLKLSGVDSSGVARMEVKFNHYEKVKKRDRQAAMHPFWKHIRPKDRAEVNLELAIFNIKGDDLYPALKLKQERRRVYIFEKGEPLMTMTLDRVESFYFPYPAFTEVELELNEIRYTEGTMEERAWMEDFNKNMKRQILENFPDLKQDQTPKYNKMYKVINKNMTAKVVNNLTYILLGGIAVFAGFLFWKREIR